MSALVWDNTGEKLFESGVDHGVLYRHNGSNKYANAYVWNGLTAVNESPSGAEPTDLWADNIKYATMRSAEEYSVTIEAYTYPEEFRECDGSVEIAPGVYAGQQNRKPFGFSYRSLIGNDEEGLDFGYQLHLVYGLTASPSERSRETVNDSPDAITFSWECESTPIGASIGTVSKPISEITIDSTKVEATALKALEDVLYGTASTEGRLPLPEEVVFIMGGTTA